MSRQKILFTLIIILSAGLLSGCVKKASEKFIEKMPASQDQEINVEEAEVSESTELDDLEKELENTVILEESFTDL
jgi:hypothetical protein